MSKALKLIISVMAVVAGWALIGVGYTEPLHFPILNSVAFVGGMALSGGGVLYILRTVTGY